MKGFESKATSENRVLLVSLAWHIGIVGYLPSVIKLDIACTRLAQALS